MIIEICLTMYTLSMWDGHVKHSDDMGCYSSKEDCKTARERLEGETGDRVFTCVPQQQKEVE